MVPTAEVLIESPIYSGKTKVAYFDIEFDAIISNIYGTKCMCSIKTEILEIERSEFIRSHEDDETLKECWSKASMNF